MRINPNQGAQFNPGGGASPFGDGQSMQQNPMMQIMMMFLQLMMSMLSQAMGNMGGQMGQDQGAGALSPMQNPGFGQNGAGASPGGNSIGNFLGGGPGGQASPGAQSMAGPGGHQNQGGANGLSSAPFAGTNGGDLAQRLPASMRHLAPHFQAAGQKFNIDPKFLAAISMLETNQGRSSAFRNKRNAMGVSNSRGPISFRNQADSIYKMAGTLARRNGPYRNANTIAGIGRIYAPPGAGNDPNGTNGYWPRGVSKFYRSLGGNPSAVVVRR